MIRRDAPLAIGRNSPLFTSQHAAVFNNRHWMQFQLLRDSFRPSRITDCSERLIGRVVCVPPVKLPNALPLHCGRAHYRVVVQVIRAIHWYTAEASVISFSCYWVRFTTVQGICNAFPFISSFFSALNFQPLILGLSLNFRIDFWSNLFYNELINARLWKEGKHAQRRYS